MSKFEAALEEAIVMGQVAELLQESEALLRQVTVAREALQKAEAGLTYTLLVARLQTAMSLRPGVPFGEFLEELSHAKQLEGWSVHCGNFAWHSVRDEALLEVLNEMIDRAAPQVEAPSAAPQVESAAPQVEAPSAPSSPTLELLAMLAREGKPDSKYFICTWATSNRWTADKHFRSSFAEAFASYLAAGGEAPVPDLVVRITLSPKARKSFSIPEEVQQELLANWWEKR